MNQQTNDPRHQQPWLSKMKLALPLIPALVIGNHSLAWQLKQAPLLTDWAAQVNPNNPWPEYPRPQMVRTNWQNLNGVWQFQPGATNDPVPSGTLSGDILVPFPMESALSGVKQHNDRAWYQRTFTVPAAWAGQKLLLHFDAVDWECEPFLNGASLGVHRGGFDPFTYDITSFVSGSGPQTLTVRIYDPTDNAVPAIAIGKQSVKFGGYFYTACSGIWQTVWLEPVPTVSIADIKLIPDVNNNRLKVTATVSGVTNGVTVNVTALAGTNVVGTATGSPGAEFIVSVPSPTLWSPTNPYLYNLSVTLQNGATNLDSVASYFGMRKISLGTNGGFVKMLLNDQFVFQLGTLDQGYWPDGVYAAPTDLALRSDIEQTKALGFNLIRKHMKVEPPRWYYWADKLGVLVWQDMPATYWTNSPAPANPQFETELTNMIRSHLNSPAIIVWTVFNEAWGQPDQANTIRICTNVMNLDPSRLVNEASGFNWYDVGHVQDTHIYPAPGYSPSSNKAVACGEFCGVFLVVTNHTWAADGSGVGNYTVANNGDDLTTLFQGYCFRLEDMVQNHGLSAAVATQITDAETEMNGFFTFDRKIRKPDVNGFQAASFSITTPFTNSIVVSNAQTTAQSWQFTTNTPPTNWFAAGFNAAAWSNGPAGFGQGVGTIRTPWTTADIWLRRTFNPGNLTAQQISNLAFNVFHDEDVEIYVNGVLAAHEAGYTTSYVPLALTAAAKATIIANATNVLAVHCHQTIGGQFVDVGLDWRNMASPPAAAAPATPTGLNGTGGNATVALSWKAPAGATDYTVRRSGTSGGPYTLVGTSPGNSFTDNTVTNGGNYFYVVTAKNAAGESGFSSEMNVPLPAPAAATFAKGADVSWVTEMEADGYHWQNRDGTQQDIFQILASLGINSVRLRVWVNPVAGYNNKADTIVKAVRAKNAGQRVMIDFHYSDTWADPGTQTKPAAWTNFSTAQLVAAVSNHTADVLSGLLTNGVTPEWVQVGNEISCGLLWPDGFTCGVTNNTPNLVAMINSGYAAVKAVSPSTRVILHLNNGQNNYRWWFDPVVNLGARFDVIGLSVYPATTTNWMADTTAALANMNDISARYGKEVVIAETGMDVAAAQACQNMLVDLMNKTRSVPNGKGLGLFYWEPEAYAYWGQTAWLNTGRPTIAMDAFAYEPNQPPGSPALFSANATTQVPLNWTVPVGATGYKLKRANFSGGPYTIIASQSATNFTDTNVVSETTYFYVVSATNIFGEGVNSSEAVGFLTTNAVALYAFEGNTRDTSGSGNHGAANGALTYTTGKIGAQAGQFNGSNSWVQIPVSIGGTNFTIAMWIKTTDAGSGGQWYNGEGLVDGELPGFVNDFGTSLSAGKFALGIGNPDTTLASATSINNGAWRHVAATWDAGSGAMKVFVDGVVNATGSGPTGSRSAVTDNLHVGNSHNGGHYFKGALDDVQLYGRVLAAPEIAALAGTAAPKIPAGLTAAGGNGFAFLHWNYAIGAGSYNVKRATIIGGPYLTVTNVLTAGFTNRDLVNETTYYFLVTATNAAGESASSAIVSVTPHGSPTVGGTLTENGSQLSLTWPVWASNYTVYAATNLVLSSWQPVTNVPQSNSGFFYVNLPVTNNSRQFFRLSGQ